MPSRSYFSCCALLVLLCCSCNVSAYYVPGTYPQDYKNGQNVTVQVNSLTSFETELPFDYYTLPFCKPLGGPKRMSNTVNLGTMLMGQKIESSPYVFKVQVPEYGKAACPGTLPKLSSRDVVNLKRKIDDMYRVNMILDNLPVVWNAFQLERSENEQNEEWKYMSPGFDVGLKFNNKQYYLHNHLKFTVLVHKAEFGAKQWAQESAAFAVDARRKLAAYPEVDRHVRQLLAEKQAANDTGAARDDASVTWMIVGFEVMPCSVKEKVVYGRAVECPSDREKMLEIQLNTVVDFTFDVEWKESPHKWAMRWDAYLRTPGGKVHWFSIMNSVLVVLVMASIVAMILVRTVRKDLAKYEQLVVDSNNMDMKDESGWKLVSGDVFRTPYNSQGLAVQVGSGVQIICTTVVTLALATLGFLSPASRGALLTTLMVLYILLAIVAGLTAVYLWGVMERSFKGWPVVCLKVSLFYPGIVMAIFTLLNIVIKHTGSTGAVPPGLYFSILFIWFLVSIPLTFVGGYIGTKMSIIDYPVKTNQIPRHVPPSPMPAHPILLYAAAGILPFGTLFIELFFALTSVWLGYFYYLFGFVFMIAVLTAIINSEIAVLCTYVQLCAEDYLWWWRSFHRGGSVAVYVAVYALTFMTGTLHMTGGWMSSFIYISYMSIFILGFYLAMGAIGFLASFWFVYKIFKAVKAD